MYTRHIPVSPKSNRYSDIEVDVNEALKKLEKDERQEPQSVSVLDNYGGIGSMSLMVVFKGTDRKPKKRQKTVTNVGNSL